MTAFEKTKGLLVPLLLVLNFVSVHSRNLERSDVQPNDLESFLSQLDKVKDIPFVGNIIFTSLSALKNFILHIDGLTGGSLSTLINSLMPCNFNSTIECSGRLDQPSLRKLFETIINTRLVRGLFPIVSFLLRQASDFVLNPDA